MLKLKKKVAFELMVKNYGPWNTWRRVHHLAYGLIRGVAYTRMERWCNDNPHSTSISYVLWKLGAWEENPFTPDKHWPGWPCHNEVLSLVQWVRKPVRQRKPKVEVIADEK